MMNVFSNEMQLYRPSMKWSVIHQRKALGIALAIGLLVALAVPPAIYQWVADVAQPYCYDQVQKLPSVDVALVLGCSPRVAGRTNLFFTHRMKAAAELYHAGKVKALIVSGDNGAVHYDEPTAMKEALSKLGVPERLIYCDYAGFRTLDSVARARSVFLQSRFIIVSQRFHNERAVFIGRMRGLEAYGFNAADVQGTVGRKTYLREYLARLQAFLDVRVLNTQPKFGGPPVPMKF
jgi:SanA protein